jgi:hypothetical protein
MILSILTVVGSEFKAGRECFGQRNNFQRFLAVRRKSFPSRRTDAYDRQHLTGPSETVEPYMAASLVPMEGGSPIPLDKPIMLIGRNQDCDITLQISSKISRRHCCIVQCGERYVLRDLGSMNGVRVNTHRVIEAELKPGDEVSVADVAFTFRSDDVKGRQLERPLQQNPPASSPPLSGLQASKLPDALPSPVAALPVRRMSDQFPLELPAGELPPVELPEEPEEQHPSRTFSDDQILNDEVRLKDDSESEAGFVRV